MGSKNIIFKTKGGETIPETSDSACSCVKVYQPFCDKTLIEILLKEAVLQTMCSSAEGCFQPDLAVAAHRHAATLHAGFFDIRVSVV